jgi:hypothetical protein
MGLTYEDRVELLKKAREAKKAKMLASKAPVSSPVNEDSDSSEEAEEPAKPVKTKTLPPKWLKNPEKVKKVKDDGVMTKEAYLIEDEPEPEPEPVKAKKVAKPRKVKESVKTLEIIAEPKAIEEVMEEVVNNDTKYKPKVKATPKPKANPVSITKCATGICLFDY